MNINRLHFLVLILFFVGNGLIFSQSTKKTDNKSDNDKSYFSAGVYFISDAIYMGRKDSVSAPYLFPSITYHNKSGFYAKGSFSYLTKSDQSRIDLFLISAGYEFTEDKLNGDISATKYFFNEDSYNVISEVEADITASLIYDFNVVNLGVSGIVYINNDSNSDFFLTSELSHDFITTDNKFQFSPTAGVYFGSQNFYESYYINNRLGSGTRFGSGGNGNGTGGSGNTVTTSPEIVIQESEKFNLMAYEFSLPMWYIENDFTLSFLPALVIPQSEATIVVDDIVTEEKLDESFYFMIGVSYKF